MKVRRLHRDVHLPTRGSAGAVGYDLYAVEDVSIPRGDRALIGTGVAIVLPVGTYGRVSPRSGLAVRSGIQVGAGVIDPDYTGEVKVLLFNHGQGVFEPGPLLVGCRRRGRQDRCCVCSLRAKEFLV